MRSTEASHGHLEDRAPSRPSGACRQRGSTEKDHATLKEAEAKQLKELEELRRVSEALTAELARVKK